MMKIDERFAVNQWLSDYPEAWTYSEILECLNDDCRMWGSFIRESDKNKDDEGVLSVDPWQLIENYDGRFIALTIEDTRRAFEFYIMTMIEKE